VFEDQHWWYLARRRIMEDLVGRLLPPSADHVIVDIGCGAGHNLGAFADGYTCVGFDTSAAVLEAARERFPNVRFALGTTVAEMTEDLGRADLVLMTDVIEHIEDDRGFAEEMVAACRPGTLFFLTVPADPRLWSKHDVSVGHHRRYVPETFRKLWRGLPVEEVMLTHYNRTLYPVVRAARALNRVRNRASGMDGTDFKMPPAPINRILTAVLTRERGRLARALEGDTGVLPDIGVSLMAVLRREGTT
jgi:SAM-dependent methyltransferase